MAIPWNWKFLSKVYKVILLVATSSFMKAKSVHINTVSSIIHQIQNTRNSFERYFSPKWGTYSCNSLISLSLISCSSCVDWTNVSKRSVSPSACLALVWASSSFFWSSAWLPPYWSNYQLVKKNKIWSI